MRKEKIKALRILITGARILSSIFIPSFCPLVGFIILLTATYMKLLPWDFKLMLLSAVYIFTIAMPWLGQKLVQRIYGWTHHEMQMQHNRATAYIIKIICYLNRSHYRLHIRLLHNIPFQSTMVALRQHPALRRSNEQPHAPARPHTFTGFRRNCNRNMLRFKRCYSLLTPLSLKKYCPLFRV